MANTAPITLEQLFRFYKQLPHQLAAIEQLEQDLAVNGYAAAMRRDRAWFATWSQGGKQDNYGSAIKLIKDFEGCHIEAYADPLHGWSLPTIGYGTTRYPDGRKVERGDKVTVIEADQLLRLEVERIADKLSSTVPHWRDMHAEQKSALISFAYNLGSGFYGAAGFETITRRLRDREWSKVPDALVLYRNPGTNVEAGLKRRREAEGRLWLQGLGLPAVQQQPAKLSPASPFSARITPHIRLGEFALDQEARRFDHQHQVDTAAELAAFLERCRTQFGGKPVVITSGYRPPAVNRSVGGASGSEHLYNAPGVGAVDFYIQGASVQAVQDWCDKTWPHSLGYGAPKGFVHLGIRRGRPRVRWDY
jgi:GH24 family phage-related lysozyme (muramidase)